jgi:hypothetical protein
MPKLSHWKTITLLFLAGAAGCVFDRNEGDVSSPVRIGGYAWGYLTDSALTPRKDAFNPIYGAAAAVDPGGRLLNRRVFLDSVTVPDLYVNSLVDPVEGSGYPAYLLNDSRDGGTLRVLRLRQR